MTTINKLREKLNLTQKEMAFLLGCSQHRVSEFETGKRKVTKQMQRHLILIKKFYENESALDGVKEAINKLFEEQKNQLD